MTIQVIGTGLGRTGTLSLKLALEQLDFAPCHHMVEVFADIHSVPLWIAAGNGNANWDAIFANFKATVDYPSCRFWHELVDYYPDAKVVHTLRDPDQWFDSAQATIFNTEAMGASTGGPLDPFFAMVTADYREHIHERAFMIDYFQRHNAAVIATVPKDRLLVYEVSQGWAPLCDFLGITVPDTPFPRENTTADFQARFLSGAGPGH